MGALGVLAALCGCSAPPGGQGASWQAKGQPIECALSGTAAFSRDCTLERGEREGVRFAVVRRPDGGFRRFVEQAGGGLVPADGADAIRAIPSGSVIEIAIGADRYRIPVVQSLASPVASHVP